LPPLRRKNLDLSFAIAFKETEDNCPTRGKKPPNKPSAMQVEMMRRCRGKRSFLDKLLAYLYN